MEFPIFIHCCQSFNFLQIFSIILTTILLSFYVENFMILMFSCYCFFLLFSYCFFFLFLASNLHHCRFIEFVHKKGGNWEDICALCDHTTWPRDADIQWLSICGEPPESPERLLEMLTLREVRLSSDGGHVQVEWPGYDHSSGRCATHP